MSSLVTLCFSISRCNTLGTRLVAKRKTSAPFMVRGVNLLAAPCLPPPSSTTDLSEPSCKWQDPAPSLPISKPMRESCSKSVARNTTAPAPSPKSTHVPLSAQSTHLERASAPITTAVDTVPPRKYCAAVMRAKTNPEQAAVRSNATALSAPNPAATEVALPKRSSGVEVAKSTKSTSAAATFARSKACCAAEMHMDPRVSLGVSTWRRRMPVRWTIHSSLVSMICAKSSLETTAAGANEPVPAIRKPKHWWAADTLRRTMQRLAAAAADGKPLKRRSRRRWPPRPLNRAPPNALRMPMNTSPGPGVLALGVWAKPGSFGDGRAGNTCTVGFAEPRPTRASGATNAWEAPRARATATMKTKIGEREAPLVAVTSCLERRPWRRRAHIDH
mmetsp:Transcript_11139/g.29632  ORF Transcript_11139/g.29632 Transcript_11139/m.29632 type:complete len:389 (-) Transcript_11139:32-1198(-)